MTMHNIMTFVISGVFIVYFMSSFEIGLVTLKTFAFLLYNYIYLMYIDIFVEPFLSVR